MPQAAVIPAPGKAVEVRNLPPAILDEGGVLLDTLYSEVCGTDVHLQQGKLAGVPYPLLPGHVTVGKVCEIRGHVVSVDGVTIEPGMVVTFLDVHQTCGHCWHCLVAKTTTRCPHRRVYGITYGADDGLFGGWSEQVYLQPGVKIIPLPEGVRADRLIAAGCALPTSIHAIDRAEIRLGDTVAVQGSGPVGLNVAILARLSGAGQVILLDRRPNRLAVGKQLGVDHSVALKTNKPEEAVEAILERTDGRGADVTIEATGSPSAVPAGMAMTRDGGRYVVVGHYTDQGTIPINPHTLINRKHLEIRGCWGSDFSHFHRMVQLVHRFGDQLAGGGWDAIASRTFALNELNEALAAVEAGTLVKALVKP